MRGAITKVFLTPFLGLVAGSEIKWLQRDKSPSIANMEGSASSISGSLSNGKHNQGKLTILA